MSRPALRTCLCLMTLVATLPATEAKPYPPKEGGLPVVEPSENADRRGHYRVSTSHRGYDYRVTVPGSYDPQRPVGLYLFFHGQGGQGGAAKGWGVPKDTLDAYNLIGINMIYGDGDNAADTAGKVEAAKEALAQVMADYPVVPGRGVISSFSGGGLPHAMLLAQLGRGDHDDRGYHWPFCHGALYGSNFRAPLTGTIPMTWVISVGQKEWDLANLGGDANDRIGELAAMAATGGSPDFAQRVEAGKGHTVTQGDHAVTRRVFRRSDLMLAPFVHRPDYPQRELRKAVEACMALRYGSAARALERVLDDDDLDPELRTAAQRLQAIVAERAEGIATLIEDLATTDPLLALWYGRMAASNHLRGHDAVERVAAAMKTAKASEGGRAQGRVVDWWLGHCHALVQGGTLDPEHAATVEEIHAAVPADSIIGIWSGELLRLR